MAGRPIDVLFLCTGNSARSIIAEALLNFRGRGRFRAFSAGSHPAGAVNPGAVAALERHRIPVGNPRSKSWDEFAAEGAPPLDVVVTVCDRAAEEVCPIWPGHPVSAHWGLADPAAVKGEAAEVARAFDAAFRKLDVRVTALATVPFDTLDPPALKRQLEAIGAM